MSCVCRPQGGGGGGDYNQQYYEQYWNNYAAWQGYGGSGGGGNASESQYYDPYASGPGGYAEYDQPAQQAGQEDKPSKEDFEPVGGCSDSSYMTLFSMRWFQIQTSHSHSSHALTDILKTQPLSP